jgi:hypothetical protein
LDISIAFKPNGVSWDLSFCASFTTQNAESAMLDWFFNCQKYTEKCSQSMDNPTPWLHRLFMWLRCVICKDSRNFTHHLNTIRKAARMDELPPNERTAEIQLSEESINRMKSVIKSGYTGSH